jgi:hypothetical protein
MRIDDSPNVHGASPPWTMKRLFHGKVGRSRLQSTAVLMRLVGMTLYPTTI